MNNRSNSASRSSTHSVSSARKAQANVDFSHVDRLRSVNKLTTMENSIGSIGRGRRGGQYQPPQKLRQQNFKSLSPKVAIGSLMNHPLA